MRKEWISAEQLEEALHEQESTREFLGSILLKRNYLTEGRLTLALSEQFRLPWNSVKNFYIDWDFVMKFSASLLLEYRCFPLARDGNSVTMGITNPLNAWAMAKAEEEARNLRVRFVLVMESEMQDLLERYRRQMNIRIRHSLEKEK